MAKKKKAAPKKAAPKKAAAKAKVIPGGKKLARGARSVKGGKMTIPKKDGSGRVTVSQNFF